MFITFKMENAALEDLSVVLITTFKCVKLDQVSLVKGSISSDHFTLQTIDVLIDLTMHHKGYYKFSLCDLKDPSKPEEESCFQD